MTTKVFARLGCFVPAPIGAAVPTSAQPVRSSSFVDRTAPSLGRLATGTVESVRDLPSRNTALWLAGGLVAAAATHPADTAVSRHLSTSDVLDDLLRPGAVLGSADAQLGTGAGVYAVGRLWRSPCASAIGADLLRAQLVAEAMTFAVKYTVRRRRPDNGTGSPFPSGHASVAFASATVLQQFGWKAGTPAYAVASYLPASPIQAHRHYLSDVVFGAAVGVVSGQAARVQKKRSIEIVPSVTPTSAEIRFVRSR